MVLWLIEVILLSILGFFLSYLVLLAVLALFVSRKTDFRGSRMRTFAIIIPAHNEELVIERTLKSLFKIEYDDESFDVIVVADNCTDKTAKLALSLGAIVYERNDKRLKGKGYALRWCFDKLQSSKYNYDAFVVVDADSVCSKNFLKVINYYMDQGATVVQAADVVQVQSGAWSPEVTRLALTLYNYVRPLGRKVIGCSAGLRGNGMCFSTEVLREFPWEAYSITEDLEYGLNLLLHGVSVKFAPEAIVYARMPEQSKNAESQRARWESGRLSVIRKYAGTLLWAGLRKRSYGMFDALIDLLTPAFVNMIVFVTVMFLLTILLAAIGIREAEEFIVLWFIAECFGVAYVFIGLVAARADVSLYKALFYFPRYALWKIVLYAKLLVYGRPDRWIRTTREQPEL